ncbi:HAD-superfamily hydrolase subfamily IIB [Rubrobacter xylanophilus DSM 9941]|uniref:Trehalose 6-phosphate phosphatase n=1 Tax=Rubrobacter xylanophilus (strain DSM 9941 / JCM 11954 / NBRC 16129 / PRD-1) TaxID=266117 RepID=Q1ARU7_RUBXD|nr:trehalose-phosphatase [Rubrobacter xylanophilus]ABG05881.1 HAD-superfamily hydrolase subfamily IIB [Rubrobacter xylanophilus DSM 9941]
MGKAPAELLRGLREDPGASAILTDIDGTLAPIAPTPDAARVPEEVRELLERLSRRYLLVAGISGRKTEEARKLIGLGGVVYFGNHGFEKLEGDRVEIIPEALPYLERVRELERRAREELGPLGAFVEEKGITASVHYRNVPGEVGERCVELVRREGERLGLRVTVGRGVVEARPPVRADKGTAVRALVEEYRPRRALFMGDDTTDLDAFRELERLRGEGLLEEALRVGVASEEGPREIVAEADLVVEGVEGVAEVLRELAR